MSSNRLSPTNGDARLTFPSVVTTLNPNAAEFVPSSFRSTSGSNTVVDVSKSDSRGSSRKTILDRSESSKSNNSDDEAHQFWRRQLPDDIIPDFGDMEKVEHEHEQLSLGGLSLNAPPFFGAAASNLSREHHGLLSQAVKNLEQGHSYSYYHENLEPTLPSLGSNSWEQNHADNLYFSNGQLDLDYDDENNVGYFDSSGHEYVTATDGVVDTLEYLAYQFPGFSAECLAELYYANGCDFNLTIEILTQLEMQVDARSHQNLNLTATTQNFSTGDFQSLPTEEDPNCLLKGNTDTRGIAHGQNSSIISSGSGDLVSADRRFASQDAGRRKFEKKSSEYGNSVSSTVAQKQYSSNARSSFGNKFHSAGKGRAAPVWLETGDAVANMYSESRGEAREFAHIRNTSFEHARQSHLIGNKALVKELSMKGQYNMQMKSTHEKAREAIYQQRNPVSSEHGQTLIDLIGLHVSEAIHILKVELAAMRNAARATGERAQAMICVGTGHRTNGSYTARLPVAVEQFLLDEGLHYTQPQPGLLRVALY